MSATPEGVDAKIIDAVNYFAARVVMYGSTKGDREALYAAIAAHVAARVGEERARIVAEIEVRTRGYVFSATDRMACDRLNDLKDWIRSPTPEARDGE